VISVRTLTARAAGALALLVAVCGLSGCIAEDPAMTAVRLVDGQLVVLLARCPDFQFERVSVSARDAGSGSRTTEPMRRSLRRTGAEVPTSLRLFGRPPTGWKVDDDGMTHLEPGQLYGATGSARFDTTPTTEFTLADLARLDPDEVLVGVNFSTKKMTEQKFRDKAQGYCAGMATTPVPTGFPPT
jgi:hypothetical protein